MEEGVVEGLLEGQVKDPWKDQLKKIFTTYITISCSSSK